MVDAVPPTDRWLAWMAEPTREALLAAGRLHEYAPDEVLLKQDDPANFVLIVERGLVAVNRWGPDAERVFIAFRGPHELLGEIGVLDERRRVAEVVALAGPPRVRVWWYGASDFRKFLEEHSDARRAAEKAMFRKHLVHQERRTRYGRGSTRHRVAHVLLDFLADFGAVDEHGRTVIDAPLNHQRIADLAGVGTDAVYSAVRKLKSEAVISTSAGPASRMRVEDRAALIAATSS